MYIDLIILLILIVLVIFFFRRFDSVVYFIAIVDIFLRILTFFKNNLGLPDFANFIEKYFPENFFGIIDKYTRGDINIILKWAFVIIMCVFLGYIISYFIRKKKWFFFFVLQKWYNCHNRKGIIWKENLLSLEVFY